MAKENAYLGLACDFEAVFGRDDETRTPAQKAVMRELETMCYLKRPLGVQNPKSGETDHIRFFTAEGRRTVLIDILFLLDYAKNPPTKKGKTNEPTTGQPAL